MRAETCINLVICSDPKFSAADPARTQQIIDNYDELINELPTGKFIDAIIILRNLTASASNSDFIEAGSAIDKFWEASLSRTYDLPLVFATPGCTDRQPLPGSEKSIRHMVADGWAEVEKDFWNGDWEDIRSATANSFSGFAEWVEKYSGGGETWRNGYLPGDNAGRMERAGLRLGVVSLNSVFRMTDAVEDLSRSSATPDQLDRTIEEKFSDWSKDLDLVLIISTYPASLRVETSVPVIGITSGNHSINRDSLDVSWFAADQLGGSGVLGFVEVHTDSTRAARVTSATGNQLLYSAPPIVREGTTTGRSRRGDKETIDLFRETARSGQLILVVTSGLEKTSYNTDGESLKSLDALCSDLLRSMNSETLNGKSLMIDEVLDRAYREMLPKAHRIVRRSLVAAPDGASKDTIGLVSFPWLKIYDFSGNNIIATAINSDPRLKSNTTIIDSHITRPTIDSAKLEIVEMYGSADWRKAAERFNLDQTGPAKAWLGQFQADLITYPTVFISESISSRHLWKYLELLQVSGRRRSRPKRFVVAPDRDKTSEWRIAGFGVTHLYMPIQDLLQDCGNKGSADITEGKRRLSTRRNRARQGTGLLLVSGLLEGAPSGTKDFLRGFDATWGDIKNEIPARLSSLDKIRAADADAGPRRPILLIVERAGTGKTTALMQFAAEAERDGKMVGWVDRQTTHKLKDLEEDVRELKPDVVVVDDIDIFGSRAPDFLKALNGGGSRLVVASVRATQQDFAGDLAGFQRVPGLGILTDADLRALVDKLAAQGLLGILRKLRPDEARVAELGRLSERDLLAAMVQVVTGVRFEERIRSEYEQLSSEYRTVYASLCVFNSVQYETISIPEDGLLQILAGTMAESRVAEIVDALADRKLIVRDNQNRLRARHRAIADKVVNVMNAEPNVLAGVLRSLLVFYASRARQGDSFADPQRRTLKRMLNHQRMVDLGLPAVSVREIYDAVQEWCDEDLHYWLQRGSYELECGDAELAWSYLESARGCEGGAGDHMVTTAWGACRLLRATRAPDNEELYEYAKEAVANLESVVLMKGRTSPQTFSVIARYGTEWLQVARLNGTMKAQMARRLLDIIERGMRVVGDNKEFRYQVRTHEPILATFASTLESGLPL